MFIYLGNKIYLINYKINKILKILKYIWLVKKINEVKIFNLN